MECEVCGHDMEFRVAATDDGAQPDMFLCPHCGHWEFDYSKSRADAIPVDEFYRE